MVTSIGVCHLYGILADFGESEETLDVRGTQVI